MSQSRTRSAWEAFTVTAMGIGYAVPLNHAFMEHLLWVEPWLRATLLTATFTVLGFLQKYLLRRLFNWIDERYPQ